jgi:lipopolysaccharide cholinephosphotransferase
MIAKMNHDMKAILGEDFFKEEIRCDYLVTAKMKRVWAVLLDLYLSFAEVCEKYGLKYFVLGGTMLGAVRHNGFIPWDDDFDVGMLREDYDELLKIAPNEFSDPLFFQTPYSDKDYFVSWAKIRNSMTTGLSRLTCHRSFNQGLYLDIFPMDYCDKEKSKDDTKLIYECAKRCGAFMRRGSSLLNERQKQDEIDYFTNDPLHEWETIQKIASNPDYYGSEYVCNSVFTGDNLSKRIRPARCYTSVLDHAFEAIEVKIPVGYDELLTVQYGDYMKFPPIEARGARHSDIIFDPDTPYTEYLIK